jgi:hypothetical protein
MELEKKLLQRNRCIILKKNDFNEAEERLYSNKVFNFLLNIIKDFDGA